MAELKCLSSSNRHLNTTPLRPPFWRSFQGPVTSARHWWVNHPGVISSRAGAVFINRSHRNLDTLNRQKKWLLFLAPVFSDSGNHLPSRIGQRCGCCDRFSGISIGGIQNAKSLWFTWNSGMVERWNMNLWPTCQLLVCKFLASLIRW